MVFALGKADYNCLLASRIYTRRYPERRHPETKSFQKLLERFVRTRSVSYLKTEGIKHVLNNENQLEMLLEVAGNPTSSRTQISTVIGISDTSLGKILKQNKFHGYHLQLHHKLIPGDFVRRMRFCKWGIRQTQIDPMFLDKVLYTDEATFNKKFDYVVENSQLHSQNRWSLNVWGGIMREQVIEPYFFPRIMNSAQYLDFLRDHLRPLIDGIHLNIREMSLQQDRTPAHNSVGVNEYLNMVYTNK